MKRYVSMSKFGYMGRAGNQMFQYAFLTKYAKQYNLELQIPPWVGNTLFGATNKPITSSLPLWKEPGSGLIHPTPPQSDELVNHDFRGYAQYHTSYFSSEKMRVRQLFQPTKEIQLRLHDALQRLTRGTKISVGIHIRRGDYGRDIFPLVPVDWYMRWLGQHVPRLEQVQLFISTEDPSVVEEFCTYNPQTTQSLGVDLKKQPLQVGDLPYDTKTENLLAGDWYPDFYLLSHCDIILGGSSTFSFFAAMLNPNLQEYWRASLRAETFVATDPWNSFPMLREHCRDFPHLRGITSDPSNPYW